MKKIGRNDPCPCHSGKKYKHCCFARDRELAKVEPRNLEAWLRLAQVAQEQGRQEDAAQAYQQAIALSPSLAGAHYNLGNVRLAQDQREEAVASFRRALELQPDWSEACCNLGSTLQRLGRPDEAIALYRRALLSRPDDVRVQLNLGNALKAQGGLEAAAESYRRALSFDPQLDDAHWNLGYVLAEQDKVSEAIDSYRRARTLDADFEPIYRSLLFTKNYKSQIDSREYLSLARGWEQIQVPAEARLLARSVKFANAPLAGRRLKLGYVSGDFRRHAVAYFSERVLASHDRSRVDLHAYYTFDQRDEFTARFEASAEHWLDAAKLSDAELAERIRADGIDVLVDLSGFTVYGRLGMFARRAAPVQLHYLGYFASTGLTEMDYWIGDEIFTPPAADAGMCERIWRLPRTWISYGGDPQAPRPGASIAGDGAIRIGSFANLSKVGDATLEIWSRLLLAMPDSRLLLKNTALAEAKNRERIRDFMAARGVGAERMELISSNDTAGWPEHMAYHDRLDVALDPIDVVSGGTTTCDALWMGVPVVTLLGARMGSRMTASLLRGLGRAEWIAASPDEYIGKVVELVRDPARRAALRSTLREEMAASKLCDARDLARELEAAYVEMFARWQRQAREPMAAAS